MATLVYSDRCPFSSQVIQHIRENPALLHIVRFHNVTTQGVPSRQITRVPTLVTNDGKLLVGQEVMNWIDSMRPNDTVEEFDRSGLATASLDESDDANTGDFFDLNHYGSSLAPHMTRELQEKISRKVNDGAQYSARV